MNTSSNLLVPLPALQLPADYPWRAGLVTAVEQYYFKSKGPTGYLPPRFTGYYVIQNHAIGLCRNFRVTLPILIVKSLDCKVREATSDVFNISCEHGAIDPHYILIHDRWDGSCWLWSFESARLFLTATTPLAEEEFSNDL